MNLFRRLLLVACVTLPFASNGAELSRTITAVKPSVVGIGTMLRTRSPAIAFTATGFIVGDGLSVITNAHALPEEMDTDGMETLGIVTGTGDNLQFRPATIAAIDKEHDLLHLRLSGTPLPALQLSSERLEEGRDLAFTGYPLGMMLGLTPVTHRAMLSAVTPIVLPTVSGRSLQARAIAEIRRGKPFSIYQLDGTAYPGNSGSPVFDPENGHVVGVINMTLLKGLKESAISAPSGISYAIPVSYVKELLQQAAPKK
ncbi:S1 family peptidase [Pseudoduganella sp. RAF53_2]|uniref:S1 family peptidase n=1 Tax=unclassified Pseudoduganella TaxID=2637179 RepID=UPI003F964DDC